MCSVVRVQGDPDGVSEDVTPRILCGLTRWRRAQDKRNKTSLPVGITTGRDDDTPKDGVEPRFFWTRWSTNERISEADRRTNIAKISNGINTAGSGYICQLWGRGLEPRRSVFKQSEVQFTFQQLTYSITYCCQPHWSVATLMHFSRHVQYSVTCWKP